MAKNVQVVNLSEPLNGARSARVEIDAGDGNLTVDCLTGNTQLLASGTLQYLASQGVPEQSVHTSNGQTVLAVQGGRAGGQRWFRLPWATCNGATDWQVHLNPAVCCELNAHTSGGNVKLDLAGTAIRQVAADTGGGNLELTLPDDVAAPSVTAKTGAGNVTVALGGGVQGAATVQANSGAGNVVVRIPCGLAARIHATTGLGKAIVDTCFTKLDKNTYQSSDYEVAVNRVEIVASSGAGNVSVSAR